MLAHMLSNATKVLVAMLVALTAFTGFAEARDRQGDRPVLRRHHADRSIHIGKDARRSGVQIGGGVREWNRGDRRGRDDRRFERFRGHDRDWRRADRRDRFRPHRHNGRLKELHRLSRDQRYDARARRGYVSEYGNGYGNDDWSSYGGDDLPSQTNAGTYVGGISAWTDPGNGTYFSSRRHRYGGYAYDDGADRRPRGEPKIIRVNPSRPTGGCSWEAGVCVIRP